MMTGSKAVQLAASYIGSGPSTFYSYYSQHVSEFRSGDWCACFVSCILRMAGATCAGFPGLYCPTLRNAGVSAGKAVAVKDARPGDVVFFNWDGNANADHVGMCESVNAAKQTITTIDGNVSKRVNRRTRSFWEVMSVIRPTYAAEPSGPNLVVDGIFGTITCKALQARLQALGFYTNYQLDGVFGNHTKREYQRYLQSLHLYDGVIDGVFGVLSVKAEQNRLKALGYYDGIIDGARGPMTKAALQRALNDCKL